jgi:hypothetical protein
MKWTRRDPVDGNAPHTITTFEGIPNVKRYHRSPAAALLALLAQLPQLFRFQIFLGAWKLFLNAEDTKRQ